MEKVPFVNTCNLTWAREKSGLSLPHIYKQSGWKSEKGKIEKWENGSDLPTIGELRKLGELYKRSWTLFIIEEKANDLDFKFLEFRKIFGNDYESTSPHLLTFLSELKSKQEFLIEFADTLNLSHNRLVGLCKDITDEKTMAEKIVSHTGIDMKTFRKKYTRRDGFTYIAECLEQKNIFIVSASSHHHHTISLNQMRGVLLNSHTAPIIGINTKNESYGARIFTIFHELVHLFKGDSFSGDVTVTKIDFRNKQGPRTNNESFCNAVAARILIPDSILKEMKNQEIAKHSVEEKCKELKVNHEPLLYRMQDVGLLHQKEVTALLRELKEDKIDSKSPRQSNDGGGGPDGGRLKLLRNGKAFIRAVNTLHSQGEITFTQALTVLDIKAKTYKNFVEKV